MNRNLTILSTVILTGLIVPHTQAAVEISADFFYDNLSPYGDWVEVGDYGYCWHPRDVDRNWRPYSNGRWVTTEAGWTWVSDEPYSWAVYHYGRWARTESAGWVWVPGTEWGPAWVSWRNNDSYVGWAPLPPEAQFTANIGFGASVDLSFDIGPTYYNFVEMRNFGSPRLADVIIEPQRNLTIINQTTNITNIRTVNNVVVNEGPRYDVVSRASAQPIPRLKLERAATVSGDPHALGTKIEGGSLRVSAPTITAAKADAKPKKLAAKIDKAQLNHGWKDAGSPTEVDKVRAKMKSEPTTAKAGPGNEPAPAPGSEARPKPGEPRPPAGEKPAVATEPPAGEPPAPPTHGNEKRGKPERVAPGEPNPNAPQAEGRPQPLEPHAPPPPKEKKEKHPDANDVPPPPASAPGEPRDPKMKHERPEPPAGEAVPEKPERINKGEPKPEPHAVPPRGGPPESGAKPPGKEQKGKEKEKDKEKEKPE